MTVLEAAAHLIREAPKKAEPRTGWPCTEFIARVLAQVAGLELEGRHAPGGDWWQAMNVWDPTLPFSMVHASAELGAVADGAEGLTSILLGDDVRVAAIRRGLEPGAWHTVQAARRLLPNGHANPADAGWGHAFMLRPDEDLERGLLLESSERWGVRINGLQWRGDSSPTPRSFWPALLEFEAGVGVAQLWKARSAKENQCNP